MDCILTIISLVVISTYVGIMIKREGIPYSISATYYTLDHKWAFGLSMLLTSALLYNPLLTTNYITNIFASLACLGMSLTAIALNFRSYGDNTIHTIGAILALVCSLIYIGIVFPLLLSIWILYLYIILLRIDWNKNIKEEFLYTKPMFWAECICLLTIYLYELCKL